MSHLWDQVKRIMESSDEYDKKAEAYFGLNNQNTMTNKTNSKHTLLSKAVQGLLVVLISSFLKESKIEFTEHEVTQLVLWLVQIVGIAYAW